jgi:hypothetical protein
LLRHPKRGLILWGLFALVVLTGAAAVPSARAMADRGVDIVAYELSRTPDRAAEHNSKLGPDGMNSARTTLLIDFSFLFAYGAFVAGVCVVQGARAGERGYRGLERLGRLAAMGALIAAACDAVENVALLRVANGFTEQPWPAVAAAFASVKFMLITVAILVGTGLALFTWTKRARFVGDG